MSNVIFLAKPLPAPIGYLDCLKYDNENGCPWEETTCMYAAYCDSLDGQKHAQENVLDETRESAACINIEEEQKNAPSKPKRNLSLEAAHKELEDVHRNEKHDEIFRGYKIWNENRDEFFRWCEICSKNFKDVISDEVYRKIKQEHDDNGCAGDIFMCATCYRPKLSKYQ